LKNEPRRNFNQNINSFIINIFSRASYEKAEQPSFHAPENVIQTSCAQDHGSIGDGVKTRQLTYLSVEAAVAETQ